MCIKKNLHEQNAHNHKLSKDQMKLFFLLIDCISEYFLFRMLLRSDISPYFLILTTVTTTQEPGGQEAALV